MSLRACTAKLRDHPMLALPLARLLATRALARTPSEPRLPLHRGRQDRQPGLDFTQLRPYQAGDEVRHIDWRVTARLGAPHTRLYQQERDQACAVLLDLSAPMYFGSRLQLKARLGAELAATLLWQGAGKPLWLSAGQPFPPQRRHPEPLLTALCQAYQAGLDPAWQPAPIEHLLARLVSQLPPGANLHLIGDHRPPSPALCQQLARLKRRHPLTLWQIIDPLEQTLPPTARLPVQSQHALGWLDGARRADYQKAAKVQADDCIQTLLPLVQRLYRLDNGRPLAEQWQEGLCRLI